MAVADCAVPRLILECSMTINKGDVDPRREAAHTSPTFIFDDRELKSVPKRRAGLNEE